MFCSQHYQLSISQVRSRLRENCVAQKYVFSNFDTITTIRRCQHVNQENESMSSVFAICIRCHSNTQQSNICRDIQADSENDESATKESSQRAKRRKISLQSPTPLRKKTKSKSKSKEEASDNESENEATSSLSHHVIATNLINTYFIKHSDAAGQSV